MPNSTPEYYHHLVTQKSWEELVSLKKLLDFVLIGGWAVYLYTKTLKSKDIDILIDYDQLPIIQQHYQLIKNERLFKYEAIKQEVEIDIYLPHMARLGIPVEELRRHTASVEGFTVIDINWLFALKLFTLSQRGRTPKGRKDFLDIFSLQLSGGCDLREVIKIIEEFKLEQSLTNFKQLLQETKQLEELELNQYKFAKIKKVFEAF